jgi:hypothetical protein
MKNHYVLQGKMVETAVVACLKLLCLNLPVSIEKDHKNLLSCYPVIELRFKLGTYLYLGIVCRNK